MEQSETPIRLGRSAGSGSGAKAAGTSEAISGRIQPDAGARAAPLIAFLLPNLRGGGVQRIVLTLARAMIERGARVDLVLYDAQGQLAPLLPPGLRVVALRPSSGLRGRLSAIRADPGGIGTTLRPLSAFGRRAWKSIGYLPALADYLRTDTPDTIFSAAPYINIEAALARRLAGSTARLVVSERTHFSAGKEKKLWRRRHLAPLMARAYAQADAIVAVSHGVADDLAATLGLPRERITVLHNPTLTPNFAAKAEEPVDHPWFRDGSVPVAVAVGRLGPQKDYGTLLRAFARLCARRPARLLIIGGGSDHAKRQLRALAEELGIAPRIDFLGFTPNPIRYMSRAALLVSSSRFEGFPNVLLEALGCGTPVVSTDCPSGPREILEDGQYGMLVPVGDDQALAEAMVRTLDAPPPRERLRARAAVFDYDTAIERYAAALLGRSEHARKD